MGLDALFLIFAVACIAAALVLRPMLVQRLQAKAPAAADGAATLVGQVVRLEAPIVEGAGLARIGETGFRVRGPDLPAGTEVRIIAVAGDELTVEPL